MLLALTFPEASVYMTEDRQQLPSIKKKNVSENKCFLSFILPHSVSVCCWICFPAETTTKSSTEKWSLFAS